jgi:hypothetical protein
MPAPTYTGFGRITHCYMDAGQTVYEYRDGRHEMIVQCHVVDDYGNSVPVSRHPLREFLRSGLVVH